MITFKSGNILAESADALVNTVNCVGIMGRGVAAQFKQEFPDNFKAYERACKAGMVTPGRMYTFETGQLTAPRYIINFPTKRHWRGKSRIEDIDAGLVALVDEIRRRGIRSIAVPPLGAGLGGLNWNEVRPRIERALESLPDVQSVVFEPHPATTGKHGKRDSKVPKMTPGRAALVGLVDRYIAGLLDPFITLLEVHKLMYFMQEGGQPLRLRFVKGPYGPYAENLRHVLKAIDGYYVSGYSSDGDAPETEISLVPGAVDDATTVLRASANVEARFERVVNLVGGFESPFGLELLSTVHWVLARERPSVPERLVDQVYAWGDRKRQFSPTQILLAQRVLVEHGWASEISPGLASARS